MFIPKTNVYSCSEYYFSIDNLERDFFLRRKMDQEGFLPIALIASFHRVQALTTDVNLILEVYFSLALFLKYFLLHDITCVFLIFGFHQALKGSKEVEIIDMKIRRIEDPAKWPLPGLALPDHSATDFSQFINCPEFVPRTVVDRQTGLILHVSVMMCFLAPRCGLFLINHMNCLGSPRASTPLQSKSEDISNLKLMPKGLSASLPDLDSESWIEVKKRPRPSPVRPKVKLSTFFHKCIWYLTGFELCQGLQLGCFN